MTLVGKLKKSLDSIGYRVGKFYENMILSLTGRISILVTYVIFMILAVYGGTQIVVYFRFKSGLTDGGALSNYQIAYHDKTTHHLPITWMITEQLDYSTTATKTKIENFEASYRANALFNSDADSTISWFTEFEAYIATLAAGSRPTNEATYAAAVKNFIALPQYSKFENDVVFNTAETAILRSRFYSTYPLFQDDLGNDFNPEVRKLTAAAEFGVIGFTPESLDYDQYPNLLNKTVFNLGIASVITLAITMFTIPGLFALVATLLAMLSIQVGVVGLMGLFGIYLSNPAFDVLLYSIGFSADYITHGVYYYVNSRRPPPLGPAEVVRMKQMGQKWRRITKKRALVRKGEIEGNYGMAEIVNTKRNSKVWKVKGDLVNKTKPISIAEARVLITLSEFGISKLQCTLSTMFAYLVFMFNTTPIFRYVANIVWFIVIVGAFHGLFVLPVAFYSMELFYLYRQKKRNAKVEDNKRP